MSDVDKAADAAKEESSTQEGASSEALESAKPGKFESKEAAEARIAELEEKQAKDAALLKKFRQWEKDENKKADEALKAQGNWQKIAEDNASKLAAYEAKERDRVVNSAISDALKDSKAKSVSTVMKLIDKAQIKVEGDVVDAASIKALIKGLKASDPVLFEEEEKQTTPSVKRASEGTPVSGYEKEIKAAKTQKDIIDVMRKYGKM